MDHRLGVVKEFKLSIYGENDDVESAIGNGKASDDAKKHKQFLKIWWKKTLKFNALRLYEEHMPEINDETLLDE
uniref:Uncharacterized protein n=1 Tax=Salix viminalis TaxID=40686 RepID=A0A6N2LF50_SALVM